MTVHAVNTSIHIFDSTRKDCEISFESTALELLKPCTVVGTGFSKKTERSPSIQIRRFNLMLALNDSFNLIV